jgi:hypothetical protein
MCRDSHVLYAEQAHHQRRPGFRQIDGHTEHIRVDLGISLEACGFQVARGRGSGGRRIKPHGAVISQEFFVDCHGPRPSGAIGHALEVAPFREEQASVDHERGHCEEAEEHHRSQRDDRAGLSPQLAQFHGDLDL